MNLYLASDHGGYQMKEKLKAYLAGRGLAVVDMGPEGLNPADDYPYYALAVAKAVAAEVGSLGILLCRSGQGVCIVANKVDGVRAALAWQPDVAEAARRDDHVNVLCLPSDYRSLEQAQARVEVWLKTEPGPQPRYLRRLREIQAIEQEN